MKKSFLLIPALAALILASCGGGNGNQSQNADSTSIDGRDGVHTVSTEENATPFSMENVLTALGGDINSSRHDYLEDENLAYFQRGESIYTEHFVKAYPLADNTYHIVETFTRVSGMNEADYEGETHYIKEFTYSNGEAKELPLQDELKPYATKYSTEFTKDILRILYGTEPVAEFQWDGTKYIALSAPKGDSSPIPTLITTKWDDADLARLGEYCICDNEGRIVEYGCKTGQFDYDDYIRMFKIYYSGSKIDSIQSKEIYAHLIDEDPEKREALFNKRVSPFNMITDENAGGICHTDKDVQGFDPKSIASMRKYADNFESNTCRQYYPVYEFTFVEKWEKEKRDDQGRLTYSEYTIDDDLTNKYKINYTYGDGVVTKKVTLQRTGEFEGDEVNMTNKYTITEKYN